MTKKKVLVAGEALVDLFPANGGRLAEANQLRRAAGGAPANVAVAMARLDEPALLWTRLGDDPFGEHLATVLKSEGVPNDYVVLDDQRKTAHTLVADDPEADQSFTFFKDRSATFAMDAQTIDDETLDDVEWVHIGGVLLCDEPARTAMLELLDRADEYDCTISYDPNTRPDLWPDRSVLEETTRKLLEHVDVVKTDREDLSFLLEGGDEPNSIADAVTEYGPHTVLVTQGRRGTFAKATEAAPWDAETVERSAFDVDTVETTGAGDAFTAGAIVGLRETKSLSEAVSFASAVGALATTATGAMTALPTRTAVESLLDDAFESKDWAQ